MITVQPFADEAEAIAMANGVEFGLASSVWTADHGRALRCARAFDFGCVRQHGHSPPPFLPWQCRAWLMRLRRVRLVAPGAYRYPGRRPGHWLPTAAALGARASCRYSRRFHHL